MDINYKAIGVRIKAARARKGVTQGYIAISLVCPPLISATLKPAIPNWDYRPLFIWLMYLMYRWMNFCAITLNSAKKSSRMNWLTS